MEELGFNLRLAAKRGNVAELSALHTSWAQLVSASGESQGPSFPELLNEIGFLASNVNGVQKYVGLKSAFGGFIATASMHDRMPATALHFAVLSKEPCAVAWLIFHGASCDVQCGTPPHLPQEPTALQMAEKNDAADVVVVMKFLKVWCMLPADHPKKVAMLGKEQIAGVADGRVSELLRQLLGGSIPSCSA